MNLTGISHRFYVSCTVKNGSLPLARSLHTTHISSDFFSWFKARKAEENEAKVPTKATTELIKEIESGKKSKSVANTQKLKLTSENFIGKEPGQLDRAEHQRLVREAKFNNWISKDIVSSERRLDELLIESYNESYPGDKISASSDAKLDAKFPDLVTKFKFTKFLQAKSGCMISDYKLTILNRPSQYKEFFMDEILSGKQARYKEAEPHAIHLTQERFSSPNIYVVPDVDVKSQNKNYRKIMQEVRLSEAEISRRAMEDAARS
ncbi:hypothetical protein HG536_0A04450 [Torulaspora globosa]|uniref:Large ribosomal subunit protein mL50 n=1 Tax=Torulaspora globosa TaxID=48254 RepID=A0A7G3ZAU2_9SACH|nr:uncharacterized protein HG536_0A04450 [Torulaspora globosa]QLL30628.1 hypothetical protein HG536_0A04450 [Torulaspora globosa]